MIVTTVTLRSFITSGHECEWETRSGGRWVTDRSLSLYDPPVPALFLTVPHALPSFVYRAWMKCNVMNGRGEWRVTRVKGEHREPDLAVTLTLHPRPSSLIVSGHLLPSVPFRHEWGAAEWMKEKGTGGNETHLTSPYFPCRYCRCFTVVCLVPSRSLFLSSFTPSVSSVI